MGVKKNDKQKRFAVHVASGMKPEEAYIKAGYSPKFAKENSFRLMQKPYLQDMIKELREIATAQLIEEERLQVARSRELALDDHKGKIITVGRWVNHVLEMIDECKAEGDRVNNRGFTEMLAKHLGAYDADNRQKAPQVNTQFNISVESDPKEASNVYSEFIRDVG